MVAMRSMLVAIAVACAAACSTEQRGGAGSTSSAGSDDDGGGGSRTTASADASSVDSSSSSSSSSASCAGGASGCGGIACGELGENECRGAEDDGACTAIDGVPFDAESSPVYAGCMTNCCGEDCPGIADAESCAHPPAAPDQCWTFSSGAIPDGWTLLSIVEPCSSFEQCSGGGTAGGRPDRR
jgi:hypothetical protein